jgi:hypothetical protein
MANLHTSGWVCGPPSEGGGIRSLPAGGIASAVMDKSFPRLRRKLMGLVLSMEMGRGTQPSGASGVFGTVGPPATLLDAQEAPCALPVPRRIRVFPSRDPSLLRGRAKFVSPACCVPPIAAAGFFTTRGSHSARRVRLLTRPIPDPQMDLAGCGTLSKLPWDSWLPSGGPDPMIGTVWHVARE